MRVGSWVVAVIVVSGMLAVVPDWGGCGGPSAHWIVLEPLAEWLGVKQHFRADGVFGPWIGLVGFGVLPGLAAIRWGWRSNRRAREAGHGRGEALLVGSSGVWLVLVCGWAWLAWPGA